MRRRVIWGAAAIGLLLALIGLLAMALAQKMAGRPEVGTPAPDFTLSLFDGGQVNLAELRGKVVVINFWASWCPECAEEASRLEQAWRTYGERDVVFLGVDYLDTERAAREYLVRHGITYPNGPDLGGRIARAYHITGVPETFIVDREGLIAHVHIGPIPAEQLAAELERLLP